MGVTSKDRRDLYYRRSKECGFRARSAWKLLQVVDEFPELFDFSATVDLCAAPGGWTQVAARRLLNLRQSGCVCAVDLQAIEPFTEQDFIADGTSDPSPLDCSVAVAFLKADITRQSTSQRILDIFATCASGTLPQPTSDLSVDRFPLNSTVSAISSSLPIAATAVLSDAAPDVTHLHDFDEHIQHTLLCDVGSTFFFNC